MVPVTTLAERRAYVLVADVPRRFPRANLVGGDAAFERLVSTVVGFVNAPARRLNLPLDIQGTAFPQMVWKALQAIPIGSTATSAEIASCIGLPKSARAVGQACGANVLAVAIPCHRLVSNDGGLSGLPLGC